ncbi:MAG: tetratricopeptide repeat protein [Desulfobacterales bacterium]|nr:tetratricopeptide repeat protein [Desulfobacterales bacterium]
MKNIKIIFLCVLSFLITLANLSAKTNQSLAIILPYQITAETDPVISFDISLDGKFMVYSLSTNNFTDIYLRSANPSIVMLPKQITSDPSNEFAPVFSPDGDFIAYVGTTYDVKGDIYLMNIKKEGSKPIRITGREGEDGAPCFSPNGRILYFHQKKTGGFINQIFFIDLSKKDSIPIAIDTKGDALYPSVSPDNKKLAFVSYRNDFSGDIFFIDLSTSEIIPLTTGPEIDFSPVWSKDGKKIFFSRIMADTDKDGILSLKDNAQIFSIRFNEQKYRAYPLTPINYSTFQLKSSDSMVYFLSNRKGIINCWALPQSGVVPNENNPKSQIEFADKIADKIPSEPYVTLLSYYKVIELFSSDKNISANAAYNIGMIYKNLDMEDASISAFKIIDDEFGGIEPYAGFSRIEQAFINCQKIIRKEGNNNIRTKIINDSIKKISEISGSPTVTGKGYIAVSRLLSQIKGQPEAFTKAIDVLDRVIQDSSLKDYENGDLPAEAMILKADIYSIIGMKEKVYPAYLSVIKEYPNSVFFTEQASEKIIDISLSGISKDKSSNKIQYLRKIAEENRNKTPIISIVALNRIGDIYYAEDELAKAKAAYQQVLEQFPILSPKTAAARMSLAEIYYKEERFKKALELYEKEIELRPFEDSIHALARDGYIRKAISSGEYLYILGEIYSAQKTFKELLDYDSSIVEAHRGYIKCAVALKLTNNIIEHYKRLLQNNPNDPILLYSNGLALTYLENKESLDEAEKLILKAISINGQIEYFYQTLGYIYEVSETVYKEKKGIEKALDCYQKAYFLNDHERNSDNAANLLLNIGNSYYSLGQYWKAYTYYYQRFESKKPFDNKNTEILFYRRLGESAFQEKENEETIQSYKKVIELIADETEPEQALKEYDKLIRYVNDRIITPGLKNKKVNDKAKSVSKEQVNINRDLSRLGREVFPPPSKKWDSYQKGLLGLLEKQERLNKEIISLLKQLKYSDINDGSPKVEDAEKAMYLFMLKIKESLDFPEKMVHLKVEMLDRLGLAYQEFEKLEESVQSFEYAYLLNEQLGLNQNLAKNMRSIAFNKYNLASSLHGKEKREKLRESLKAFQKVIELLDKYGVAQRVEEKGRGLLNIKTQVSLDQMASTEAAHGFTKDQEMRLANTFIAKINIELLELGESEKAFVDMLKLYPYDKEVAEKDLYGVSLLFHRAGHISYSRRQYQESFKRFKRSLELSIRMKNPASAVINLCNITDLVLKTSLFYEKLFEIESFDKAVLEIVANNPAISENRLDIIYHNVMGVFYAQFSSKNISEYENAVLKMRTSQNAYAHFEKGIKLLESQKTNCDRQCLYLLSVLHLNFGGLIEQIGYSGKKHFETASRLSDMGMFFDIKWRADVSLGKFDEALIDLKHVSILRAGCGKNEIMSAFSPKIKELTEKGLIEEAFNLSEKLSELERFNRIAPMFGKINGTERNFYRNSYLRLSKIYELKEKLKTDSDKEFLEQRIAQEYELLGLDIGKKGEKLPDIIANISDTNEREKVIMLFGLAVLAEDQADSIIFKTDDLLSESLINNSESKKNYVNVINQYQDLRKKVISQRPKERSSDLFALFGSEPFEAIDVMENLPQNSSMLRLIKIEKDSFIGFFVNGEGLTYKLLNYDDLIKLSAENNINIIASEELFPIFGKACYSLSASHYVRSLKNRKSFKQAILEMPSGSVSNHDYSIYSLKDLNIDNIDSDLIEGINTLILSYPAFISSSVPVRSGEKSLLFFGVEDKNGKQMKFDSLMTYFSNLSLALIENMDKDDVYIGCHLFSIYGCPTIIFQNEKDDNHQLLNAFLKEYKNQSAYEAKNTVDSKDNWIQFGYKGMTPSEIAAFNKSNFIKYVKQGIEEFKNKNFAFSLILFEKSAIIASSNQEFSKHLSGVLKYARESAYNAGNFDKALKYASKLTDYMKTTRPDSQEHAESLMALGLIDAKLSNYDKAVPNLEESLEIVANLELTSEQIKAFFELGVVLENATDYERAVVNFESAASLSKGLRKNELLAKQYTSIGRIYDMRLSKYAYGIQFYKKALEIWQELKNNEMIAESYINIGRCYRLLGNFQEADKNYDDAMNLVSPDKFEAYSKVIIEKANNAWFQGRYDEAFRLQRKAYNIAMDKNFSLMKVISLNTSGLIFWTLGEYKKALLELNNALEFTDELKARPDEIATTLNNIGVILRDIGRYGEALEKFEKALEIDTKLKSKWAIAYDFRNKALTLFKMGKPEESIPLFEQALYEASSIGNKINEAKAAVGLGDAYFTVDNKEKAKEAYTKALSLSQSMSLKEVEWRSFYGLAMLEDNNKDEAKKFLYEAIKIIEKMRADIKIEQLKDSFITDKVSVYEKLVSILVEKGEITEAFEVAERSRARNFIDILGNQNLKLKSSVDKKLYDKQNLIRSRIKEYESLIAQAENEKELESYKKSFDSLQNDLNSVMLEIQMQNPELASMVSVSPLKAKELMAKINNNIGLLCYYVVSDEIFYWLITKDDIKLFRTPIGRGSFEEFILDYRRMMQNLEPLAEQSKQLYEWILAPAVKVLSSPEFSKITTLGIVPHASLHYLSFATLSNGNDFLIDKYPIFYIPSASVLDYTMKRRQSEKNLKVLAIGNPDLGDPIFNLPFSEYEVGSIKWNFPNITILTKDKAVEDWIVNNISQFGIIHLASHGEFDPINPLFSAIKLARGAQGDGNLEASEVFGLSINADMVILSACQTGLAKVTGGDDVIGLNRAFFYAGTHTVISSLWRVSDVSTAILIKEFYRQYTLNNKADSLRKAILHVKKFYPHPGYWGAFSLVGDYY